VLRNWFPNPRWKTYAAQSGYVYQYIFEGVHHEHEYVFRAISGTQIQRTVEVILDAAILADWVEENRPLTQTEAYGIAKMALMRALDGEDQPARVEPSAEQVAEICRELDL
jgi:hypothetical protein